MIRRRLAASAALALGLAALVLLVVLAIIDYRRGFLSLSLLALSVAAAWQGIVRRGASRVLGLSVGASLAAAMVALLISGEPALVLALVAALALVVAAASYAFYFPVALPRAPRPARPVLFHNPRSGGGKVARFPVPDEARARSIEPIELTPGTDLEQLVRRALDDGGVDGEALVLEPPLRFRIRPAVLRCRIARQHGGASPSTFAPDGAWAALRTLLAIATGQGHAPSGAHATPAAANESPRERVHAPSGSS
jgi:hypothetical protein